jgi:hypothetical protein
MIRLLKNIPPTKRTLICSLLLVAFEVSARAQNPAISADELVRRTAAHELAAANIGGHYQYRFEEHTVRGSETRDILESRDWTIDHLILKDGRPLTAAEQQREKQRLHYLFSNPARFAAFQKEQSTNKEYLRTIIAAFPQAFSCQYDKTAQGNVSNGLIRVKFHPNPGFISRSWQLRPLQGMEGTLLIDPDNARLVRMETRFFRNVDFGGGILGRIDRGGSFEFEQQPIGDDHRAITTVALHFNKRVLLMKTRIDSVTKASGFQCIPKDMTLQQGFQQFLNQPATTIASCDARPL